MLNIFGIDEELKIIDILNSKFVKRIIINLYNYYEPDKLTFSNDFDLEKISGFVIRIFREEELYNEFIDLLGYKYSRLKDNTSEQDTLSAISSFSYLRDMASNGLVFGGSLSSLGVNHKVDDILGYDIDSKYDRGNQFRRTREYLSGLPLLTSDGYEIIDRIDYDDMRNDKKVITSKYFTQKQPFYAYKLDFSGDTNYNDELYYIHDAEGVMVLDLEDNPLVFEDVSKVCIIGNEPFYKKEGGMLLFNRFGEKLIMENGLEVDDVLGLYRLGGFNFFKGIVTKNSPGTYFFKENTRQVLKVKLNGSYIGEVNHIHNDREPVNYAGTEYYYVDVDYDGRNRTFLIDQNGNALTNEKGNLAYFVSNDFVFAYSEELETLD